MTEQLPPSRAQQPGSGPQVQPSGRPAEAPELGPIGHDAGTARADADGSNRARWPSGPTTEDSQDQAVATDAPTANISLLGPPGSGKTTYLAALGQAVNRADRANGRWNIFPANERSEQQLVRWTRRLVNEQVFPDKTEPGVIIPLKWLFVGNLSGSRYEQKKLGRRRGPGKAESKFMLDLVDVSGEAYGYDAIKIEANRSTLQRALKKLEEAKGFIFLFDPITERDAHNASTYIDGTIAKLSRKMVNELVDGYLPHEVSVCVTKFDNAEMFQQARRAGLVNYGKDGMPRVLDEHAEAFFDALCEGDFWGSQEEGSSASAAYVRDMLKNYFHPRRIKYFVTSSVGYWRPAGWDRDPASRPGFKFDPEDFHNLRTDQDGNERIRGVIHPINVLEPLISLQQRLAMRRSDD